MLSEAFVASSLSPPKAAAANSTLLKDAGIYLHEFQPHATLRATFKKSSTSPNCLAVSESHIFTAQTGKAVAHVYNREKGNQEAVISFPERISCITLAEDDTVLILGTEGGGLILWEICTGRQVTTPAAHLNAVTVLAVDIRSNFVMSASLDSVVHVWNLLDLLTFHPPHQSFQDDPRVPCRTFSLHRSAVSALAVGHSGSFLNIAVSASRDRTALVWNYHTGELLRTFLLPEAPLCAALDPVDRAFYVGYENGSVQLVDFYLAQHTNAAPSIHDSSLATTPMQPPVSSQWAPVSDDVGPASCIAVCYDGTMILTGHSNGKVISWDVATGRFANIIADFSGAPITNLRFLPPTGFPNQPPRSMKIHSIIKPRPFAISTSSDGQIPENYTITAQFQTLVSHDSAILESTKLNDFEVALYHPSFPPDLLAEGIAEIASLGMDDSANMRHSQAGTVTEQADFMHLDGTAEDHAATELQRLHDQIAHLKKLQETSFTQIGDLDKERRELRTELDKLKNRRLEKLKRRRARADREWAALGNAKPAVVEKSDGESSGPTTSSVEETSGEE